MADSNNSTSGGIGFTGLLTIVFITLKLTHVIAWSWWWILSPIWISASIALIIILIGLVVLVSAGRDNRRRGRRRG